MTDLFATAAPNVEVPRVNEPNPQIAALKSTKGLEIPKGTSLAQISNVLQNAGFNIATPGLPISLPEGAQAVKSVTATGSTLAKIGKTSGNVYYTTPVKAVIQTATGEKSFKTNVLNDAEGVSFGIGDTLNCELQKNTDNNGKERMNLRLL